MNNDLSYFKWLCLHFRSIFAFTSVQLDSECYSESQLYLYGYIWTIDVFDFHERNLLVFLNDMVLKLVFVDNVKV